MRIQPGDDAAASSEGRARRFVRQVEVTTESKEAGLIRPALQTSELLPRCGLFR